MIQELQEGVEKLFVWESKLCSANSEYFPVKSVVYFSVKSNSVFAFVEDGTKFFLKESITILGEKLKGLFVQANQSFLVSISRIRGIVSRYPDEGEPEIIRGEDECELVVDGISETIAVTNAYSREIMKTLSINQFAYLTPENQDDKRLRLFGIIDFGWRELEKLDPNDKPSVEAFKKKWDVKIFSKERLLKHFRLAGANKVNKRQVIKNIIWQMYRWIVKGIERGKFGNIRSLWYLVKRTLDQYSNILKPGDVDIFYNLFVEMVEEYKLFKYRDFKFMDLNQSFRKIGDVRPEIILAAEKLGQYPYISEWAAEVGTTFICLKGEPASITLEYFSDELWKVVGDKDKQIFCISDIDPAGYSIEGNLVKGLVKRGHKITRVMKLVDLSLFAGGEANSKRFTIVSYLENGDVITPIPPAKMSSVTKARDWFLEQIKDNRLWEEKDTDKGKLVTIYGIESNDADMDVVRKRFLDNVS